MNEEGIGMAYIGPGAGLASIKSSPRNTPHSNIVCTTMRVPSIRTWIAPV